MRQNRPAIIAGIIGLLLTGVGVADLLTTDAYTVVNGEQDTISYYLVIGIVLLVISVIALVRGNKRIK